MGILWEDIELLSQVSTVRNRDEIESAIWAFTPAEWARLHKIARYYTFNRPIEADDLLQGALWRALDGRNCPTNVDVIKFLAGVMRSIIHGELEKAKTRPVVDAVAGSEDRQRAVLNYPDPSLSAEEVFIDEQEAALIRRTILALFDDDHQARDIVEGRMEGMSAEELRELTGLDMTTYASKLRLIRRRIDKAYPEGWKP